MKPWARSCALRSWVAQNRIICIPVALRPSKAHALRVGDRVVCALECLPRCVAASGCGCVLTAVLNRDAPLPQRFGRARMAGDPVCSHAAVQHGDGRQPRRDRRIASRRELIGVRTRHHWRLASSDASCMLASLSDNHPVTVEVTGYMATIPCDVMHIIGHDGISVGVDPVEGSLG